MPDLLDEDQGPAEKQAEEARRVAQAKATTDQMVANIHAQAANERVSGCAPATVAIIGAIILAVVGLILLVFANASCACAPAARPTATPVASATDATGSGDVPASFTGTWTYAGGLLDVAATPVPDEWAWAYIGGTGPTTQLQAGPITASFTIDAQNNITAGEYHASLTDTYTYPGFECTAVSMFDATSAAGQVAPSGKGTVSWVGTATTTTGGAHPDNCGASSTLPNRGVSLWFEIQGDSMNVCAWIGNSGDIVTNPDVAFHCVDRQTGASAPISGTFKRS